mmetsp:Transcript_14652/g.37430  ORF Transcript_14652/g.37430 Transcript_14652/m.37430 type:complete len:263 (-) Transcript_14652:1607-2395(-)|eukprot:CAMPEP_0113881888 /NCGR_PEP_ID=MMETSP0780_2-20120614/8635_1 /TAXON_ID=652834 /ORGANISM="Palpitomonas bilix" /LENGTH=262 /DNA_ID=CAMNT_0000868813 /DNA_START=254 /DNA_END=1042 /DNA_ORIENTATION=+ /assembly_acc=CAM_ASM_000599
MEKMRGHENSVEQENSALKQQIHSMAERSQVALKVLESALTNVRGVDEKSRKAIIQNLKSSFSIPSVSSPIPVEARRKKEDPDTISRLKDEVAVQASTIETLEERMKKTEEALKREISVLTKEKGLHERKATTALHRLSFLLSSLKLSEVGEQDHKNTAADANLEGANEAEVFRRQCIVQERIIEELKVENREKEMDIACLRQQLTMFDKKIEVLSRANMQYTKSREAERRRMEIKEKELEEAKRELQDIKVRQHLKLSKFA